MGGRYAKGNYDKIIGAEHLNVKFPAMLGIELDLHLEFSNDSQTDCHICTQPVVSTLQFAGRQNMFIQT